MGIEPTSQAWEAWVLPLDYARTLLPFPLAHQILYFFLICVNFALTSSNASAVLDTLHF